MTVALTDNPGDVDSVWVDIGEIYLQGEGDEGRQTLLDRDDAEELGLIELTRLADRTLDIAEDVTIDAGHYGQLRFVLDGAVLETEDGEVFAYGGAEHPHDASTDGTLNCPSCSQTGIKVVLSDDVANLDGGAHVIVLDFDVSESFGREAGASGMWVMHPVIRAAEIGFTGTISGTVDVERDEEGEALVTIPACPAETERDVSAFVPRATAQNLMDDEGDPIVSTTTVDEEGSYSLGFLEPDDYALGYVESVEFDGHALVFTAKADPETVDVSTSGSHTADYTITDATCETLDSES